MCSIYTNVDGFSEAFFAKPQWLTHVQRHFIIHRAINLQHLLDRGNTTTKPVVASWFCTFVNRTRRSSSWSRLFFASGNKSLTDSSGEHKCDIFHHPTRAATTEPACKNVLITSELKKNPNTVNGTPIPLQIAGYVHQVIGAQPSVAFTISRDVIWCCIFHGAQIDITAFG